MTLRPRFVHFLLVLACACAALAASPFASSQSPTSAAQQGQGAQPAQQVSVDSSLGAWHDAEDRRTYYRSLMRSVASEEWQTEQALKEGRTNVFRSHFQFLGIPEDEERVMRSIIVEEERRMKETEERFWTDFEEQRSNPSKEQSEKSHALTKELGQERVQILDETIARLMQQLGEEDFKKLDDYIYRDTPAGMAAAAAKRRANAPDPQQSGSGSDPRRWPRSRL